MCQRSLQESTDISTSCRTTASGTPRAREHVAYGVASSLESQTCSSQIWISATRCSSMVGYAGRRAPAAVDPSCRSSPAKRTRKAVLARHGAASRRRLVGEAVHLTCCVRPRRPHLPLPDSSLTLWTASSPRSTVVATDPNNLLACCRAPTAKAGELPNVSDQGLDMTPPPVRIPLPTKGVASLVCKA
jgi:hypothetical protein